VSLLLQGRNSFTVRATSRSEVIRIPSRALKEVLASYPHVQAQLIKEAMTAEEVARSAGLAPPTPQPDQSRENTTQLALSWTALIDKGVLQGHEVLVINQDVCTNCNNCVDACGRRHGYSRLERRGLQLDNLLFPTACRHCEDPVCLLCSVNGIVRLPNGEITIVADNCIGCGACAERCPYGNIRMHHIEDRYKSSNFFVDLFDFLRGGDKRQQAIDTLSPEKARVAVKCDLCAGYNDYACVTACPVGAAFRVDPVQAFKRDDFLIGLEMKKG
jgi:Fe-S-cluster-containing hydrogenase component 2